MPFILQLTPDAKQRADTLPPELEAVGGAQNLTNTNSAAAEDVKVHVTPVCDYCLTQYWSESKLQACALTILLLRGSAVVKALHYKREGRGFKTWWGEWMEWHAKG
jgi:hypothetical protein